jgi:hypothetical protein
MFSDEESSRGTTTFDLSYEDPIIPRKRPVELQSSYDELDEAKYRVGTAEYKKARKRRQNRESAIRSRSRKKFMESEMQEEINRLRAKNAILVAENEQLRMENDRLRNTDSTMDLPESFSDTEFKPDIICPSGSVSPSWLLACVLVSVIFVGLSW